MPFCDAPPALPNHAAGLGENVVGGHVNPDEWLVYKPMIGKAPAPIIRRIRGDKAIKRIYSKDPVTAEATVNVPVSLADRRCFSLEDSDVLTLAQYAKAC